MSLSDFSARADRADQELDKLSKLFAQLNSSQESSSVNANELQRLQEENRILKEKLKSIENSTTGSYNTLI